MTARSPQHESARAHGLAGFTIFPAASNSKIPQRDTHFKECATSDLNQIDKWWTDTPDANIGVYCGRFGDGQALAVIDIDLKNGKNGFATIDALQDELGLTETYQVETPSGGRHLYYVVPKPLAGGTDKLGPGVDIKSHGGYVIGAGSVIDGKPYVRVVE